ncbi:hypothetical protein SI65_04836 [Aspergillus cristatus]|uniref:C2H2-type domain-containing protein n=1 Tax=Aspergillus cristatus TaxID=573508 RepID=A0A1E3BFV1_ASPCR|nr:hypothetical protein SI65_04836 [Aspergillus cristatus]
MSSQLSPNHPSIETSLKDPSYSDPYLSAPLDPDEAAFRSSAIRLTPVPDDIPAASSPIPSDFHTNGIATPSIDTSCFDQDSLHPDNSSASVFSPGEELLSNPSLSSPNADDGMTGLNLNLNLNPADFTNDWQQNPSTSLGTQQHGLGAMELSSPQPIMPAAQLLSPSLSEHTSPTSDLGNLSYFSSGNDALLSPEGSQKNGTLLSSLITTPLNDNLSVHADPESARARSPIVMVEDTSGDLPSATIHSRRLSSAYLSPGGMDDDEDMDDDCSSISRASDGSWIRDTTTGLGGVDPTLREDIWVPSPNDMEAHRQIFEKTADIHSWTATVSAATSEVGDDNLLSVRGRGARPAHRRRAKSTGDASLQLDYLNYSSQYNSLAIPGPGVLIQEKSDVGSSEPDSASRSESPVASILLTTEDEMDHDISANQPSLEYEDPLPSQFIRARQWQDNLQGDSSTAAMLEFQQRAREMDNASRMATWGTRHVNEAEVSSIVGGDSMEKLTIGEQGRGKERRSSLLSLLPRAASPLKRQRSMEFSLDTPDSNNKGVQGQAGVQRKTSVSSNRRKLSIGRSPRSTSISTGGAMAAIAGSMAAIGGGNRLSPGPPAGWSRGRSKSEVPPPPPDLMVSFGGPSPVPSPGFFPEKPQQSIDQARNGKNAGREDDEDEEEEGMVMEFPVQSHLPIPTHDGFKTQITQLNPRLASSLVDRLANEQVRRYKKLVDQKASHSRAIASHSCSAGKHCFGQGGEAKILPPRTSSAQDANAQTQFQIPGPDAADEESEDLGEGTVTAAQFPPGVPLPPVQRLPAEFECPFCFKVKSFQKPSDWSKHVHEDVQPFTCTFQRCNEPKSFKRKADWVRHESERHRQLEWWTCTMPDCSHTCYRKDNFVQHLVREHKMPEPKAKKGTTKNKGEENQRDREIARFWELVENCRHETTKNPRDEPCRFCGNVCSSWKKLTVHLAKHMEQIALPVLGLVQEREVGPTHTNSSPAAVSRQKSDMPAAFGQDNTATFNLTYPPPQLTTTQDGFLSAEPVSTTQDGFLSAEPESMNLFEELASPQFLHPETGHHSPLHQSSVSYPPPFNSMSRPHTPSNHDVSSNPDMSSFYSPSPVMLSPGPLDTGYDAQGSMFLSPTTEEDYFKPDLTATSLSYDSGMAHHMQNQYM